MPRRGRCFTDWLWFCSRVSLDQSRRVSTRRLCLALGHRFLDCLAGPFRRPPYAGNSGASRLHPNIAVQPRLSVRFGSEASDLGYGAVRAGFNDLAPTLGQRGDPVGCHACTEIPQELMVGKISVVTISLQRERALRRAWRSLVVIRSPDLIDPPTARDGPAPATARWQVRSGHAGAAGGGLIGLVVK